MKMYKKGRIVLTGSPGTGKSEVLNRLSDIGYKVIEEPARNLIELYQKQSPEYLPWNNRDYFQEAVEKINVENYLDNREGFFDRSIVDEVAFRKFYDMEIPENLKQYCLDYRYDKVFLFPPWKDIFKNDMNRKISFEGSVELNKEILKQYKIFGYNPIEVIKGTVNERVNFILNTNNRIKLYEEFTFRK